MVNFGNDWDKLLEDEFKKDYYLKLRQFLANEYKTCPYLCANSLVCIYNIKYEDKINELHFLKNDEQK